MSLREWTASEIEEYDDARLELAEDGKIECTRVYIKTDADQVIAEKDKKIAKLKADNKRLWDFRDELVKDCKWLPTTITPDKSGFETMVQCTNGKKRVASFRMFDFRWYDVNNGNKLNVVKWLWQPRMPNDEKKYNDELRHQKYKRCLAMASYWLAVSYQCVDDKHRQRAKKHRYKWLELAEQFKEAK